jgi:hypothetical protein
MAPQMGKFSILTPAKPGFKPKLAIGAAITR